MNVTLARTLATVILTAGPVPFAAAQESSLQAGAFRFAPLQASAECAADGGADKPFVLPNGFTQDVIAREGDGGSTDAWDMNTLGETGLHAGQYLYRSHETAENGQVTRTDLETGVTTILAERHDWNRLDGLVWTSWGTLLVAEEMRPGRLPSTPDPELPQSLAGLVYEIEPTTGTTAVRPAIGARAHEGLRFDPHGNLYGISETAPNTVVNGVSRPGGYIFKFTPDRPGDLSTGQLYALRIVEPTADRVGEAIWVPLDRTAAQIDADAAASAAGATGYGRPEDVETAASTGNVPGGGNILFVAVTNENRVLRVDLRGSGETAYVSDYVRAGVNAPADFNGPDNLALDKAGNLYITEDGPVIRGNDIWVAVPGADPTTALRAVRFASLSDCTAEPSGIYFDRNGKTLYVNVLGRDGVDPRDVGLAIRQLP